MSSDQAATTILKYAMRPDQAFVALPTDLTLTITNPAEGAPVTLSPEGQGDEIDITVPIPPPGDALTDSIDFTARCDTVGFVVGQASLNSNLFNIKPVGRQTLAPGQTIRIVFSGVVIDPEPGAATLAVAEYIGDATGNAAISVEKLKQELKIIAWLDPIVIGPGGSTLYWQSFGGTNVTVYNLVGGATRTVPVQGNPPYAGSMLVRLTSTDQQRTFTLIVSTNDRRQSRTEVTLSHAPPAITGFGPQSTVADPLPVNASIQLSWSTLYASAAFLTTPAAAAPRQVPIDPLQPMAVTPGADAISGAPSLGSISARADYTLTVDGWQTQATRTVGFPLAAVRLLYFKFQTRGADGRLSGYTLATDPPDWSGVQVTTGDVAQLALYQPGGAVATYFLGSADTTHPQIQYFAATPVAGAVTLEWVTANLASLTLEPGAVSIATGQIASGSINVCPAATTTYTLTGVTGKGRSVSSVLVVPGVAT
jgi:hypothetical protein